MFNNTTSYPLLLVQSLHETGILSGLIVTDGLTRNAIERAKSYFLVFATVSSCLTFAIGPRLIDSEHASDPPDDKEDLQHEDKETYARRHHDADTEVSPTEQAPCLPRLFCNYIAGPWYFSHQSRESCPPWPSFTTAVPRI
jgi:hypothetical protein